MQMVVDLLHRGSVRVGRDRTYEPHSVSELEQHVGQRVIDLVRDTGGERAYCGETLGLRDHRRLQLSPLDVEHVVDRP
ncbi:MAG TPA: hypothetical protein VGL61_21465 [Kofleriaceae bacterium]